MEKNLSYIELFEIYQNLLTEKQKELFNSYYMLDLSLSEIAENENTTRQSVFDLVKKVENKLNEYEQKLKLKEKQDKIIKALENYTNLKTEIMEIIKDNGSI